MSSPSHCPPPTLRWSGMTHVGRFRKNNEDAFLALTFDAHELRYLGKDGSGDFDAGDYVFAVSDGMGGAKSGEVASKIAVEKITRLLPASFKLGAQRIESGFGDVLGEIFTRTHDSLVELGRHYEECRGMGATLSLCWFMPGWMAFAHVGDSRIYYIPAEGGITQISEDHSPVGRLFRAGKINEREARSHPSRSLLEQVLGGQTRELSPQIGRVECRRGDRFLICSDGLTDGIWSHRLADMVREPGLMAQRLVEFSVNESGRDNTTALVIEIT